MMRPWVETNPRCPPSLAGGASPPSTSWPSSRSTTPARATATRAPCCGGRGCTPPTSWSGAGPRDAAAVEGLSPRVRQPKTSPEAAALAKANRRIERLEADLAKHKLALDMAGKAHALLEMLAERDARAEAEAVIDAC